MNVDEAMKVAKHESLGWYDDMHEAGPILAAEVERLRVWKTRWKDAAQKLRRQLEEAGDGDNWRRACRRVELELEKTRTEVERLRDELDRYKKSLPVCEKHKPDSGCRSGCMICGLEKQSSALSRIDYACGEPNEMQMSLYGLDYDEERVVKAVQRLKAELAAAGDGDTWREACGRVEAELAKVRTELAAAKAASVVPVELVALGDADWQCSVGVKTGADADKLYKWLRERMKDTTPPTT